MDSTGDEADEKRLVCLQYVCADANGFRIHEGQSGGVR